MLRICLFSSGTFAALAVTLLALALFQESAEAGISTTGLQIQDAASQVTFCKTDGSQRTQPVSARFRVKNNLSFTITQVKNSIYRAAGDFVCSLTWTTRQFAPGATTNYTPWCTVYSSAYLAAIPANCSGTSTRPITYKVTCQRAGTGTQYENTKQIQRCVRHNCNTLPSCTTSCSGCVPGTRCNALLCSSCPQCSWTSCW